MTEDAPYATDHDDDSKRIYKLLFKSCRFAPQCLRKIRSQQLTRLLFYVIVLVTLVRLQICPL
jgi:hypothetical protein